MDLAPDEEREERAFLLLDDEERARSGRFLSVRARRQFVLCRAALRVALSERLGCANRRLAFGYLEHGKPFALVDGQRAAVGFNVSHSGTHGLMAFAADEWLGVDVEERESTRDLEGIGSLVYGPAERRSLALAAGCDKVELFYRLWSMKEALIKAVRGAPLARPPIAVREVDSRPMRAVEIAEPGPPEALRLVTRPTPRPGPGEVLVRVAAAGINRADVMQREGRYPPPPGASDLPGLEVSGMVAATGPGAGPVVAGDRVCAIVSGGAYAEYCLVPAAAVPADPGDGEPRRRRRPARGVLHRVDQRRRPRPAAGRRVVPRPRRLERRRQPRPSSSPAGSARGSSPPPARPPSAPRASSWAPSAPSTTARRTSSPSSATPPAGAASTSCSTWSAGRTSPATSPSWRRKAAWS